MMPRRRATTPSPPNEKVEAVTTNNALSLMSSATATATTTAAATTTTTTIPGGVNIISRRQFPSRAGGSGGSSSIGKLHSSFITLWSRFLVKISIGRKHKEDNEDGKSAARQDNRSRCCCWRLVRRGVILAICVRTFAAIYSTMHSADPCQVLLEQQHERHDYQQRRSRRKRTTILPTMIHQQWKDDKVALPPHFQYWRDQWKKFFPKHTHILWTDETMRQLIATNYSWFLPTYDAYPHAIQRVDVARYFILYTYGGLYIDLDVEPLPAAADLLWCPTSSSSSLLPTDRVSAVESPHLYAEHHQNSIMSSPAHHDFWNSTVFPLLVKRRHLPVLQSTGPSFLDAAINQYHQNGGSGGRGVPGSTRGTATTNKEGEVGASRDRVVTLQCENFHRIPNPHLFFSSYSRSSSSSSPSSNNNNNKSDEDDDDDHMGSILAGRSFSPFVTRLWNQAFLGTWYPMKYCGDFDQISGPKKQQCHLTRHHNAVSYLSTSAENSGIWSGPGGIKDGLRALWSSSSSSAR